ncbi:hypothetical protein [Pseudomonas fluorescens]|uniref:hypothetical protein n=1 Tax=Pseudomonas fluorescens TaxID=294 RepID=UPI00125A4841|nr:hypothetical protein [Pseudomonas fluorescens]VVN78933.1 hypothetical protein PS720_00933 [Pseudomonas fluorescens]
MSHNFKPGDLALIVGARRRPDAIGKVVELVEYLHPGQEGSFLFNNRGPFTNGDDEATWLVVGDIEAFSFTDLAGLALVSSRYLMPLRGDFAPEQQKAKEAV